MHPVYLLAFATFVIVVAFGIWALTSVRRNQQTGGRTSGVGGPNDPLAGENAAVSDPDDLRFRLEVAAERRKRAAMSMQTYGPLRQTSSAP